MRENRKQVPQAGLSLVEMLVAIAIIGIIASIVIPKNGRSNQAATDEATYRRSAQSIATVFASAQSAGLDFSVGKTTESQIIEAIVDGGTVTDGALARAAFEVRCDLNHAAKDIAGAAKYLTWDRETGLLRYTAEGGAGSTSPSAVDELNLALAAFLDVNTEYEAAHQRALANTNPEETDALQEDLNAKLELRNQARSAFNQIYYSDEVDRNSKEVSSAFDTFWDAT